MWKRLASRIVHVQLLSTGPISTGFSPANPLSAGLLSSGPLLAQKTVIRSRVSRGQSSGCTKILPQVPLPYNYHTGEQSLRRSSSKGLTDEELLRKSQRS
jgi:hypothetical protein